MLKVFSREQLTTITTLKENHVEEEPTIMLNLLLKEKKQDKGINPWALNSTKVVWLRQTAPQQGLLTSSKI